MFWKVLFKPRPRCLRDQLEIWFVYRNGMCMRFNLAGLIPYIGVPLGLVIGVIISFVIEPDQNLAWDNPKRYMPVLLAPAVGVIFGLFIRYAIIGDYYLDPFPERDEQALERILEERPTRKRTSRKAGSSPRNRSSDED
ncbi:MAG: hypothetical protein JWM11_6093 [Planctomycetaceae bacterium]|nr:hypothetical protein [Planctomycetaceae bacterium]